MIIETLTAFTAVQVIWESLEILHLAHVGHMAGKVGYQGGHSIIQAIQQKRQNWHDQKNPAQQLEREAKTLYDFDATGDMHHAILSINNQAEAYLAQLNASVSNLESAKNYFLAIHSNVTTLSHLLTADDVPQFSSQLLQFKSNFESFKGNFKKFLSIEPPSRQVLYIANVFYKSGMIRRYNDNLKLIEDYINLLGETRKQIAGQFRKAFEKIAGFLNVNARFSLEQLQHEIKQCMQDVDHGREKLYEIVSNEKLADACIEIMQIAAAFQPIQEEEAESLDFFKKDSHWFPLLTEEEQIEVGQRIILHAMNESTHSEEEKLLLAKIFLRKPVSKQLIKQIEVNLLTYEIVTVLRNWQIKKCEQLIQLLNTLTQGVVLPNADPDQLFEWLKIKKRTQSPTLLLTEILVSPCCFSRSRNVRLALDKIKNLTADNRFDALIEKHPDCHWGAVWEKSDPLIQLPKTFCTAILPRDCVERESRAQTLHVVSSVMERLAEALRGDLQRLKIQFEKSHFIYSDKLSFFTVKYNEIPEAQKKQEHEAGVTRIKQAQRRLHAMSSSSNSLFPYLYRSETINEVEKKQQVATEDDLAHLIYRGVDPGSACSWKSSSSQPYSPSNQLISYFYPDKPNDSRSKAYFYAFNDCEVNALPLFSRLFPSSNQPLALKNTSESPVDIKNSLSIQTILKNPEKVSSMFTQSTALNSVEEKTVQETETVFQQLHDYYVLALTRVEPEYIHSLSFMKQLLCLIRNFFKFGQEIGEERFQSVRIFIGDLCAVLSAKDVDAINQALDELKNNYKDRYQNAERVDKSALYTTMKQAFEGPFLRIINHFTDIDQEQFKLNLEKELQESKLKNKVRSLQKTIVELKQENALTNARLEASDAKLRESYLERAQDRAEFEQKTEELEQKNAVMKADIGRIMRSLRLPQQHTDTEVEASASSNHAHFFGSR